MGLVLLENSSAAAVVVAAAVTAAAVTAAAVAAAAVAAVEVAVGGGPQKSRFCINTCRICTLFQWCAFRKYIVHMFKILTISKRGSFEQQSDGKLKNGTLVRVPWYGNSTDLYHLGMPERIRWVRPPETPLFGEIDHGFTFWEFGKYSTPPSF